MEKAALRKLHAEEREGIRIWKGPKYYDYPDGEDLSGKLSFTTKIAFLASLAGGLYHSNAYPFPTSNLIRLLRIFKVVVPGVGMAVTFTCVTYYSTIFRKKDDPINYALGGAAAGLLVGPAIGKPMASAWAAFYFAIGAAAKKHSKMEGRLMMAPQKPVGFHNYTLRHMDFSCSAERKSSGWTRRIQRPEPEKICTCD